MFLPPQIYYLTSTLTRNITPFSNHLYDLFYVYFPDLFAYSWYDWWSDFFSDSLPKIFSAYNSKNSPNLAPNYPLTLSSSPYPTLAMNPTAYPTLAPIYYPNIDIKYPMTLSLMYYIIITIISSPSFLQHPIQLLLWSHIQFKAWIQTKRCICCYHSL